jgi:hypothetical protein
MARRGARKRGVMDQIHDSVVFLIGAGAGIGVTGLLYLLRRNVWQLFAGLMRVLLWPFRLLLRLFGLGKRVTPDSVAQMGPTAWAATAVSGHKTLTETALGHDFAHEEGFIQRQGLFFRWLAVRVGFMRVSEELTDELAEEYGRLADEFLGGQVPISSDPRALFEDIEGAVIARQFFESDRGVLYLLNASRKVMNDNVRKLSISFSAILGSVLLLNVLLNDLDLINDLHLFAGGAGPIPGDLLASLVVGAGSCLGAAVLMWALFYAEYAPYQRNTAREMANFLTRYLARVNDHYRTAVGKAKSVTVGQERDSERLAAEARLWSLNISWIALRVFFIETYVRNVVFQITRNSSYYLIFVPAGFLAALGVILGILSAFTGLSPFVTVLSLGWVFLTLFVLIAVLYGFFLSTSMKALEEIDQGEWISFHTLRLNQVLGEVIGKYAEDVGYWKNRVGGSM